jgi:hypothetical protein
VPLTAAQLLWINILADATVAIPGLRTILGLKTLDAAGYGYVSAAVALSIAGAYISARATRDRI